MPRALLPVAALLLQLLAQPGAAGELRGAARPAVPEAVRATRAPPLHAGVIPPGTLSHYCVVSSWDGFNATLQSYSTLFGVPLPPIRTAGGLPANGTYLGQRLRATTLQAFLPGNNGTRIEFLAGEPSLPSWWRDVYLARGLEVHHTGYSLPPGTQVWPVVQAFEGAGLGRAVQWGRWGNANGTDAPGAGCYAYVDSQGSLGVTIELLAERTDCDSLPAPPA